MTKKKTLISESVIRRWGKLAAMPALTENWLTEQEEEMEMDAEMDVEDDGEEVEVDMDMDMEAEEGAPRLDLSAEQVEVLVQGIADTLSELTGEEVDVEADEEVDMDMDMEMDAEVEDLADDDAAMRDAAYNRKDETLDVEVIDDEDLTEAVLSRVVERLLRRG